MASFLCYLLTYQSTRYQQTKKQKQMDAIIMCAGAGTRLRPLTLTTPKPLVPVLGRSPLERLTDMLPASVDRIILIVGYLGDVIERRIGHDLKGRHVAYLRQETQDGTGGALRRAKYAVRGERFLVLNGDDLYDARDLEALARVPCGVLYVSRVHEGPVDGWMTDPNGYLTGIATVAAGQPARINAGAYCLDRDWFRTRPVRVPGKPHEWSLPHAIPELVARGKRVKAIQARFWMPVGTPEELARAELALESL
jgi:bifunctional UDP-N-acetylglucosamine pyrophosphorylase/glucosamine-1-phosphate N-acetyltransferase